MNSSQKIECCCCGLDYPESVINYHLGKPFCSICSLDHLVEMEQKKLGKVVPGYFLNETHYNYYLRLRFVVFNGQHESKFDLAAYINSIPALFNIYPYQESVFRENPFLWPYNWRHISIEKNAERIEHISVHSRELRSDVNQLISNDCKALLYYGYELFHVEDIESLDIQTVRNEIINQVTSVGEKLLEEIDRFYLKECNTNDH